MMFLSVLKKHGIQRCSRLFGAFARPLKGGMGQSFETQIQIQETKGSHGAKGDVFSVTGTITRYLQNGRVDDARQLFDKMPIRNVVTWNAMIAGLFQNGQVEDARQLFDRMPERDLISWNAMIAGYVQNGIIEEAHELFDKMPERNVVSWTTLVTGFAQNGFIEHAFQLFEEMPERNVVSWNAMIAGCWQNGRAEDAIRLFNEMPERNISSWNAMITGYAQEERIEDARQMFDEIVKRNTVSWTAMIAGYAQNGQGVDALKLFSQMQWTGTEPNQSTFTGVLCACASLAAVEEGKQVHLQIIKSRFQSNDFIRTALITMYAKSGNIIDAELVFNTGNKSNVVLWNAILAGYCQNERLTDAHHLFDKMANRDVVSWNTMIAGYAQSELAEEALKLFLMMKQAGKIPTQSTYTSYLHACSCIAGFEQGKQVHAHILKVGFKSDVFVGNGLITMYAKCGSIGCADQLFREMPKRDVVSWTAVISGYAKNGKGNEAVQLFLEMRVAGIKPNLITMTGVLSACSHVGLVDEGCHYFNSMSRDLSITPTADHYACIVDLLCRAGRLDEAEVFIKAMPFEPDMVVLASLLAACREHVNVELGKWTAERMFELEPQNSTTYILLSNMYAAADRWDDVRNVRNMMKATEVKKEPGCSWIEVKSKVHIFLAGDQSHPQSESIYAMSESLAGAYGG